MRIVLQIVEMLLYLIAIAGIAFGIAIIVIARHADTGESSELRAATTLAAIYLAIPPFTLGVVGLAGGAVLTAIDRLRQER